MNEKNPILAPQVMLEEYKKLDASILTVAITINPDNEFQFLDQIGSERIKKATNHIKYLVRKHSQLDLELHIDISKRGRIHWHGLLRFRDIKHIRYFYEEFVPQMTTQHTMEVDTISNMENWMKYCNKTKLLWNVVVETNEVCKIKTVNKNNLFKDITEY